MHRSHIVLMALLTVDKANAAATLSTVPNTTRKSIFTTRPFLRVLGTVA